MNHHVAFLTNLVRLKARFSTAWSFFEGPLLRVERFWEYFGTFLAPRKLVVCAPGRTAADVQLAGNLPPRAARLPQEQQLSAAELDARTSGVGSWHWSKFLLDIPESGGNLYGKALDGSQLVHGFHANQTAYNALQASCKRRVACLALIAMSMRTWVTVGLQWDSVISSVGRLWKQQQQGCDPQPPQ
jgi:hypothetical protein